MSAGGTHRYHLPLDARATEPDAEVAAARLWAAGALGVWERADELVAWFADDPGTRHDDTLLPAGGRWSHEPDRDWQAAWKATIGPVHAPPFVVVPSWAADAHDAAEGEITLVLDPGRAFGSGHHATTTLCLEALGELVLDGRTVLDVGCGSGILGIAAARRGATVVAVDLDPDAVTVTRENAVRNGVTLDAHVGSVELATDPAEVLVANLITEVVIALVPALVAATAPGGTLILSGIAADRHTEVSDALQACEVTTIAHRARDGWSLLVAQRTSLASLPPAAGG